MRKSVVSSPDDMDALEGALYAVSLDSASEQLETAHQKDLQLLRDQFSNFQHATVLDHSCDVIEPALPLERRDAQVSQQARLNQMGQVATNRQGARKETTAQSFFGKKNDSTSSSQSTTSSSNNKRSQSKISTTQAKKKAFFGNASTTTKAAPTKKKTKPSAPAKPEEKENTINVGTADDFVGDEDEDDEFMEQEKERESRNAEIAKEQEARERARQLEEERLRAEEKSRKAAEAPVAVVGKKRRKRMVEKTTMDESGYMHTETTAVWEEIDDDEPVVATKRKPVKSTKNMKQGNLMGFFAKKK